MQVNRSELLTILNKLKPGLSAKERVSQSNSFVFSGGDVITYNEQVMIMHPSPLDIEGAVRAEELLGILNKLKSDEVDIILQDGQMLIKAGKSKSGIRFDPEIKLPIEEAHASYSKTKMTKMPAGLLDAFSRAKFCASQSMSNIKLTGLHVKDGFVSSSDNYRIFQVDVEKADKLPEFILPASCIDCLENYAITEIGIHNVWAFFTNKDDLLFCVRLIGLREDDPYPDVSNFLTLEGVSLHLPEELTEAIDKTNVFTKTAVQEMEKIVTITIKQGRIIVRGEGSFGWHEENIPTKGYKGEELSFSTHPEFLRAILPHVQQATLGDNAVLFEGDDFKHTFVLSS